MVMADIGACAAGPGASKQPLRFARPAHPSRLNSMSLTDPLRDWKQLYIAAVLESDDTRLLPQIQSARMAICDRAEEFAGGGTLSEKVALNAALEALGALQEVHFHTPANSQLPDAAWKNRLRSNRRWHTST